MCYFTNGDRIWVPCEHEVKKCRAGSASRQNTDRTYSRSWVVLNATADAFSVHISTIAPDIISCRWLSCMNNPKWINFPGKAAILSGGKRLHLLPIGPYVVTDAAAMLRGSIRIASLLVACCATCMCQVIFGVIDIRQNALIPLLVRRSHIGVATPE